MKFKLLLLSFLLSATLGWGQITEGFEGTPPPAGWTYTSVTHETANFRTGAKCAGFNANNDAIVSPLVTNPGTLSFWWRRSGTSPTSPVFTVQYGSSATGPWTDVTTGSTNPITSFTTTYQEFTADLSSLSNVYIRVLHTRAGGANVVYIDDFSITASAGCTAPSISAQPSTTVQNLCQSAAATALSVTASGSGITYQWYSNAVNSNAGGTPIVGATSATYTPSTAVAGTLYYYCVVTGTCGNVTSSVSGAVNVTASPANPLGSISAVQNCGNTSLTYSAPSASLYWQTSATGTSTANATTAPYAVSSNGTYYVRAFNGTCWSTGTVSQAVTVVNPITISSQPTSQSATTGNTATFSVTASNAAGYQWQVNTGSGWANIGGATSASYTTPAATLAMNGYQYQVIVTGNTPCGNVTSSAATLSVTTGPCLSENFNSNTLPAGWAQNGGTTFTGGEGVFGANNCDLATVIVAYPSSLTFDLRRTNNTSAKTFYVEVSTTTQSGTYTAIATYDHSNTTSAGTTSCTVDLSAYSSFPSVYIKFRKVSSTASPWYLDNMSVFCATPPSGPEINVTGNSITILDNDTTPSTADGTSFGSTVIGNNIIKTFTIHNQGTTDLVLSGPVTLTDVSAPQEFVISQPAITTIPAGGSTTFTVTFNSAVAGTFTNTINIGSNDTDEALYNFNIVATATNTPTTGGTVFNPGELIFVGYDGQINGSGAADEYLVATLVDMLPGTQFSIVNSRYEAGAAANVRTDKWGGGGDFAEEAPYVAKITYNGAAAIPAGSVLRFVTDNTTAWFDLAEVTVGTTTTDRTADFTGLTSFTMSPNISTSGSDQLYLMQGDFVSDGTIDLGQANYYLNGTLLHGLTNRASWVSLSSACNGDDSGGNSRESRLPSALTCFNVQNVNGSAVSGYYENDKEHGLASIRQIINGVADVSNNWTLGTGRYTKDPSSNAANRAGKTFLIGASNPAGNWVGNVDTNWFNCANWEGLTVPKTTTNVLVSGASMNEAVVDYTAAYSNEYGDLAVCNDLTITGNKVGIRGNVNNKLEVHGNLAISGSGTLSMDDSNAATADGQLYLTGNWSNTIGNTAFEEGNGTVHFNGTTPQIINNVIPVGTEVFYNVVLNNNFDTATSNDLIASGDLTVATGKTLNIDANGFAQVNKKLTHNGTITVQNDGQFIQIDETDTNTGTYTGTQFQVKRNADNIRSLDYVYWSAPVENTDVASINGTLRYYWDTTAANPNGTQGYWLAATGTMNKGQGYIVRGPSSFSTPQTLSVDFNGKPFNGQFNYPITRGTNGTSNDDNLILVGNPYASAIDADAFLAANPNIEGAVRIWTHGTLPSSAITSPFYENFAVNYTANDYIVYNGTATTVPGAFDGKIASGQGFFITMLEAGAAAQNITFRNAMRGNAITGGTLNNTQFFKNTAANVQQGAIEKNRIWLDLISANGEISKTVVGYVTGATMEKDNRYDAYAKLNYGMTFYSLVGEEAIHIQGRALPFDDTDVVPMGMQLLSAGNYTVALAHLDGLFAGNQDIYLEDRLLNIVHNLKDSPYSFTADAAGFVNDRFVLRYTNETLGNEEIVSSTAGVNVYANDAINVVSTKEMIQSVAVYDVLGRLVAEKKNVNATSTVINNVTISKSAYIVKVVLENGAEVSKKIIY